MSNHIQDVTKYDVFSKNQWVKEHLEQFRKDANVAAVAIATAIDTLTALNKDFRSESGRPLFTSVEGRVKTEDSFFNKLHQRCCQQIAQNGFTKKLIADEYNKIYDLAGVRVACPYFDQIEDAVQKHIRPRLRSLGIATDLRASAGLEDKDLLEQGDRLGYRAYHFSIRIPAVVDIFGNTQDMICEIQARSELQNVWAAKSHDLLYKPKGWLEPDDVLLNDMKAISQSLNAADQHLAGIRKRLEKPVK